MQISWDDPGSKLFEAGIDRGVFFPKVGPGVAWNGLTSVKEFTDNEGTSITYVDGQKVINQLKLGDFAADISAITYPDEMYPYDGYSQSMYSGQSRSSFNLSYRSLIGNGREGVSYGYRLHLIFNCMLTPSNRDNNTLNQQADISEFQWKLSTKPVAFPYDRPTAHLTIDSTSVYPQVLSTIEDLLYGSESVDSRMPSIEEILSIFEANAILKITDYGNGIWSAEGPDEVIQLLDTTTFQITWPSAIYLDDVSYRVSSL